MARVLYSLTFLLSFTFLTVSGEWSFNKWYAIVNTATGLVVDGSTGYVTLQPWINSDFQKWQPVPAGEVGLLYLKNNAGNVRNHLYASPVGDVHYVVTGAPVALETTDSYQWLVGVNGTILSAHGGWILDVLEERGVKGPAGSKVIVSEKKFSKRSQQFVFEEVPSN